MGPTGGAVGLPVGLIPPMGCVRMMDLVCRQGGLPVRVRTCLQQAGLPAEVIVQAIAKKSCHRWRRKQSKAIEEND